MKYVGSKNRLAKYIVPILQKIIDAYEPSAYIEPFVGGANVIDKISCKTNKFGIDNNYYLISLWKALQAGWTPPESISEDLYNFVRTDMSVFPPHFVGLVGFCATYGAKWFGGYARGFKADKVTPRDIPAEGIRNIMRQVPKIKDVQFIHGSYERFINHNNCIIYCDPPYKGTEYYKDNKFDHEEFYEWCRTEAEKNIVVISEYWMPEDFICIWKKEHKTSLDTNTHYDRVERLFIHEKNLDEVSRIFKENA